MSEFDVFGDDPNVNKGPIYIDNKGVNTPDNKGTNIPDQGQTNNNNTNNVPINNNNNKNPNNPEWIGNRDFPEDPKIIIDPNSGYVPPNPNDKGTSDNYLPFDPYTNLIPSDEIVVKKNYDSLVILGILALFLIITKNK